MVYSQNWVKSGGGLLYDYGSGVAGDNKGNIFLLGRFQDSAFFDSQSVISNGGIDIFIAKYDSLGNVLWSKNFGGISSDYPSDISCDIFGNVFLVSYFSGTISFDSILLASNGLVDIAVAKLNPEGNVLWAKNFGGSLSDYGSDITSDAAGNVYVAGYFSGTVSFDSFSFTSAGESDGYTMKCDSAGNVIWAKQVQSTTPVFLFSMDVDLSGNALVSGRFSGQANIETQSLTSDGDNDVLMVKYNTNGVLQWAKRAGGNNFDCGFGISADVDGNIFVTGSFRGSADFGSINLTSVGEDDLFIAKYNSAGNIIWANSAGGMGIDRANNITTDIYGNGYITGLYNQDCSFGNVSVSSVGGDDIFVAKYNNIGNLLYVKSAGGSGNENSWGIFMQKPGLAYLSGMFEDSVFFGSALLTGTGEDAFLWSIADMLRLSLLAKNATCVQTPNGKAVVANIINGTPPYDFSWSNSQKDSLIVNIGPGIYTLTVTDSKGVVGVDSVQVNAEDEKCPLQFYTGITPNGNNLNDLWFIEGIEQYQNNVVTIFNRHGQKVWHATNYDNKEVAWKGTNQRGEKLTDGTFYYVVEVPELSTFKGWVQIVR